LDWESKATNGFIYCERRERKKIKWEGKQIRIERKHE
jgi:hypothetical protein